MDWPSGSGHYVQDLIAKGLTELGHEVFYHLPMGIAEPLPPGATHVESPVLDADVLHTMTFRDHELVRAWTASKRAWVATCHLDPTVPGRTIPGEIQNNWIFVSRTLAESLGRKRYVTNGIDPTRFCYSEQKSGYLLFLASIEWAQHKGLDIALRASREAGTKLVVCGGGKSAASIEAVERACNEAGAEFAGDVRGAEKAQLLAGARALLFPTQVNEAFGLVIAEALMSGTPVICSANGACPELVTDSVGFVCSSFEDYVNAIAHAHRIEPLVCRQYAMARFHYHRMAQDYVREYQVEIAR